MHVWQTGIRVIRGFQTQMCKGSKNTVRFELQLLCNGPRNNFVAHVPVEYANHMQVALPVTYGCADGSFRLQATARQEALQRTKHA